MRPAPRSLRLALLGLLLVPAVAMAALNPGQPDPAFGTAGYQELEPSLAAPKQSYVNDIAVDAAGRVLVTGQAADADGSAALYVARLLADGKLDPSFGDGGVFVRQLTMPAPDTVRLSAGQSVEPAPDGGVLVAASRYLPGNNPDLVAVKLNPAGRIDLNYGASGVASVTPPSGQSFFSQATSAVVKPDGSMFLTGLVRFNKNPASNPTEIAILRFSPEGTGTDATFTVGDASPLQSYGEAITLLPSGKMLTAGTAKRSTGNQDGFVKRLLSDGTPDGSAFGSNGTVILSQLGAGSEPSTDIRALAAAPDSAFYAASIVSTGIGNNSQVALTRYGAGGQLDSGFGPGGTRTLSLIPSCTSTASCGTYAADVRVDGAGRVLVVAYIDDGDEPRRFGVARYLPNGLLDSSFGTDGVIYGPVGVDGNMNTMAIGPDNRLLLGGHDKVGSVLHAWVARLALEHVDDPAPTPSPSPSGTAAPSPSPSPTPSPAPTVDRTAPALNAVKVKVAKTGKATLSVTSSEAGSLTVTVKRARKGRRKAGKCSTKARRGKRCTAYGAAKTVRASLTTGTQTVALGTPGPGRYRAVVSAADAAGNRTKAISVAFRVKRR